MGKKISLVAIFSLIIGVVLVAFILNQSNGTTVQNDQTATRQTEGSSTNQQSSPSITTKAGVYTDYSESAIATASGKKILFFHAPWCPQCRDLDQDIQDNGAPAGTTIFKIDYDSNQDLRKKYGVTVQTTLVLVDDSGNLVKKFVAYADPSVESIIENLL